MRRYAIVGLSAMLSLAFAGQTTPPDSHGPSVTAKARSKSGGGSSNTKGGNSNKGGGGSGSNGGTSGVTNLYVSPQGDDSWSGTSATTNAAKKDGPLATLTRARDLLRSLRSSGGIGAKGAVVNIMPGSYRLTAPFQLGSADSGTDVAPITYRGTMAGAVEITGGVGVANWRPVSNSSVLSRLPPRCGAMWSKRTSQRSG